MSNKAEDLVVWRNTTTSFKRQATMPTKMLRDIAKNSKVREENPDSDAVTTDTLKVESTNIKRKINILNDYISNLDRIAPNVADDSNWGETSMFGRLYQLDELQKCSDH